MITAGHDKVVGRMPNRRDLFNLTALNALAAFGADNLQNATRAEGQANVTHEPFGDVHVYFDGPTEQLWAMTAGSLRLKTGMSPHPPHQHPEEEILLGTEGAGEISIDGKGTKMAKGAMMF